MPFDSKYAIRPSAVRRHSFEATSHSRVGERSKPRLTALEEKGSLLNITSEEKGDQEGSLCNPTGRV